ncbi:hypothetical protein DPEC_G00162390 [Dallia pectoralis]|uniref:Uncharacterized protein n=1 Tax=Dallia pectoralis TaxID=75939 RepID=A0ACC2GGI9_DALPE|nr:hypothetical protein DPEC_G00162390 [Dallia pectoralis]
MRGHRRSQFRLQWYIHHRRRQTERLLKRSTSQRRTASGMLFFLPLAHSVLWTPSLRGVFSMQSREQMLSAAGGGDGDTRRPTAWSPRLDSPRSHFHRRPSHADHPSTLQPPAALMSLGNGASHVLTSRCKLSPPPAILNHCHLALKPNTEHRASAQIGLEIRSLSHHSGKASSSPTDQRTSLPHMQPASTTRASHLLSVTLLFGDPVRLPRLERRYSKANSESGVYSGPAVKVLRVPL